MRAVIQRVSEARVGTGGVTVGEIGPGLLILLGVAAGDTNADCEWLAHKIAKLRVFSDETGHMNLSLLDIGGDALVISQFTLLASTRKGTRPSWDGAARPEVAQPLYEAFLGSLEAVLGEYVPRGQFGADMSVSLVNVGPVTLVVDSQIRE